MKRLNAVYACIVNGKNHVLMVRNRDSGLWSLPGGKVEDGEYLEDALVREVYEETGYHVSVHQLIALNECKLLEHQEHVIFFTYRCRITGGHEGIALPDEIAEIEWADMDTADRRLPYHPKSLRAVLKDSVDYVNQGEA